MFDYRMNVWIQLTSKPAVGPSPSRDLPSSLESRVHRKHNAMLLSHEIGGFISPCVGSGIIALTGHDGDQYNSFTAIGKRPVWRSRLPRATSGQG